MKREANNSFISGLRNTTSDRAFRWCRLGNMQLVNISINRALVAVHFYRPAAVISSKKQGPRMKVLVILHPTVTFNSCNGRTTTSQRLQSAQCAQFFELTLLVNEKWASSVHKMRKGQLSSLSYRISIHSQNLAHSFVQFISNSFVVAYHRLECLDRLKPIRKHVENRAEHRIRQLQNA